jgi:hypothetical protein
MWGRPPSPVRRAQARLLFERKRYEFRIGNARIRFFVAA